MRILLDQSVHDHRNQGNNSLLEVALARFKDFWPDASYYVISNSPHLCQVSFPGTRPVSPENLLECRSKLSVFHQVLPNRFWWYLFELREMMNARKKNMDRQGNSKSLDTIQPAIDDLDHYSISETQSEPVAELSEKLTPVSDPYPQIGDYDLYTPTGGGYMCDSDKHRLLQVFDRIEAAIAHGTQVVMVGQGIGPMEDLELLQRAKEVLCHIDYIMIREERIARPLLDSLDVPRSKVFMTGDDAIELAYQARNRNLGNGIGLSLRVAHYTGLNKKHLEVIRSSVIHAAEKFGAQLIAAPIDVNDADKFIVDNMIKDYLKTSLSWRRFETPKQIIKRIGQCRIMVSGTFHGAVFALGQGIPVVALAVTDEYNKKLGGLTAEFGENGCQIVNIDENDSGQRLMEAIEIAWSSAEQLRTELLWNAKRQIDLGYEAYEKIFQLVNSDLRVS